MRSDRDFGYLISTLCYYIDPCVGYKELRETDRSATVKSSFPIKCDTNVNPELWYRFNGGRNSQMMLTKCVERYMVCGAFSVGWMKGNHPSVEEGIVNRTACFYFGRNCCQSSKRIQVRNCGRFFVYKLKPFSACNKRYCGAKRNFCDPDLCQHGKCLGHNSGYQCKCDQGYSGKNCHLRDYCASNPCQNGVCKLSTNGYQCLCNNGYAGEHCNVAVSQGSPTTHLVSTTAPSKVSNSYNITQQMESMGKQLNDLTKSIASIARQSSQLFSEYQLLKKNLDTLKLLQNHPSEDIIEKVCTEYQRQANIADAKYNESLKV
ncbi:Oncoprotein-induced transcript 3 protein [Trichoplax sp. H2]|nr:Oncoprotein-induced transcript 3 protein [Trichoplax sp. H2]|eukprot:RDD36850.1 Oncoprotein-induced transcript 3 protein [Trichoplax sp. H2]